MKVFDEVVFMKKVWKIIEIDHNRKMYKIISGGILTYVKESDLALNNKM